MCRVIQRNSVFLNYEYSVSFTLIIIRYLLPVNSSNFTANSILQIVQCSDIVFLDTSLKKPQEEITCSPVVLVSSPWNLRYPATNLYKLVFRHPKSCLKTYLRQGVRDY